ncbi:hypothetical protein WA158_005323 [Blastocystis sp. Blastoise]
MKFVVLALFLILAMAEPNETVKTILKPFQNEYLHQFVSMIIGENCYNTFVNEGDLLDKECLKITLSKGLGYGIVVASAILKMPQIIKILSSKTVTGLNVMSFYLECFSFLPSVVYNYINNYPFSTYGESVIILIQNIFLVFLFWKFASKKSKVSIMSKLCFLLGLPFFGYFLMNIPKEYQYMMPIMGTVAAVAARVPQIITNHKQHHTGQLSLITWLLTLAGNVARIFTILTELDDTIMVICTISSTVCNVILVLQILIYWKNTNKVTKKSHKKSQ